MYDGKNGATLTISQVKGMITVLKMVRSHSGVLLVYRIHTPTHFVTIASRPAAPPFTGSFAASLRSPPVGDV